MRSELLLYLILASILVATTHSHDLVYKSIRPKVYEDLPDTIPIFKKVPAFKRSQALHLPSVKSTDSHGNKCHEKELKCFLSNGQHGCCPFENGTCCLDKLTCCPSGYECNIKEGTCTVLKGEPLTKTKTKMESVVCPDGQSQCPDGSTCCKLQSGQWGCCPLEKATCCSDGVHCCPNGYKCDVRNGTCTRSGEVATGHKLSSCCTFVSGSVLCCKNGLVCDQSTYECAAPKSEVDQIPTTKATRSDEIAAPPASGHVAMFIGQRRLVACSVGHHCGTKSTCCLSFTGTSTCCGHMNGVCCAGGSHCCPSGFACTGSGKCALAQLP